MNNIKYTTKLFSPEKVKKFFRILSKLSGSIPIDQSNYPWRDYKTIYTKDSNHCPCAREVFVHRTINKWLRGKALIIYRVSDFKFQYKQYVSIAMLHYLNDWSDGYINVSLIDYSRPLDESLFNGEKIKYNDALKLEGEWCDDLSTHNKILEFISMDNVPIKEYVFIAYDFSKFPKRKKKGVDSMELIKTTRSFFAKTEYEAYELMNKYQDNSYKNNTQIYVSNLIETKEVK